VVWPAPDSAGMSSGSIVAITASAASSSSSTLSSEHLGAARPSSVLPSSTIEQVNASTL
jgi:hypothetical protein